jgi:hypothetical protein
MDLVINYLLVGIIIQFFIVWGSRKTNKEELLFTNLEQFLLVIFWPIVLVSVVYYTIKTIFFEK